MESGEILVWSVFLDCFNGLVRGRASAIGQEMNDGRTEQPSRDESECSEVCCVGSFKFYIRHNCATPFAQEGNKRNVIKRRGTVHSHDSECGTN